MAIENLNNLDTVNNSTLFAVNQNGLDYNATGATVAEFLQQNATSGSVSIQYSAPTTGSSVSIVTPNGMDAWLVLTPAGTLATLTIILPQVATAISAQEIVVNSTQAVTTLTINGNSGTVIGAPTSLAANGFFRLRFEPVLKVWYRIS